MADLVEYPVTQALAWALVHFVWQGAVIALATYLAFRVARSASLRYAIGVGALAAMLAAPIATFVVTLLDSPGAPANVAGDHSTRASEALLVALSESAAAGLGDQAMTPIIRISPDLLAFGVAAWLAGVLFFSLRLAGGWVVARRMVYRSVQPAAMEIQALAARVADRLALRQAVSILESSAVMVPVMVGWLKPTIVLPIAALAGLTPTQVEALIAHELAHVRRHDYLVNLLQSVTEAILFYHPAVWWLSRRVRAERELCCDDLAIGVCDPLVYATALTDLAAMTTPRVALAATDGDLLGRVRRILGHSEAHHNSRGNIMSGIALGLVATIAIPVALISATQSPAHSQTHVTAPAARHTLEAVHHEGRAMVSSNHLVEPQTAGDQADQRRIEELRRTLEQIQRQLAELEMKRNQDVHAKMLDAHKKEAMNEKVVAEQIRADERKVAIAHEKAAQHAETVMDSARRNRDIEAARHEYDASRKLFEKGLVSSSQMQQAEQAVARAQAKGNADAMLIVELQDARQKLARSKSLVEKGLMSSRDLAALEALVANLEQRELRSKVSEIQNAQEARAAGVHAKGADVQRIDEMHAARTNAEELRARQEQRRVLREIAPEPLEAVPSNASVRAGDTLGITIEGEPDLPSSYAVRPDGTIRIPFIGSIKVVGLTTTQVRDAIGKQLGDRRLGSASQVRVALRRQAR